MEYPAIIKQIMKEAPMSFSIMIMHDYISGKITAYEADRRWEDFKKSNSK